MSDRWVAIDFETATPTRGSACAVSAVEVVGGEVARVRSWLIKPPGNEYSWFNVAVHGIGPEHTVSSPSFAEMWPELDAFIAGGPLVAHNAGFDVSVLRAECFRDNLTPAVDIPYACTLVLSRLTWPGLASYSLPWVCDHLDIDLVDHHDPTADAIAAAQVGLALLERLGVRDWSAAVSAQHARMGVFGSEDIRCAINARRALLPDANPDADPDHPFFGTRVCFTGALDRWIRREAAQLAANCGAAVQANVTKATDYLVVGVQDPTKLKADGLSAKMRKALEIGDRVTLLTELEFEQML